MGEGGEGRASSRDAGRGDIKLEHWRKQYRYCVRGKEKEGVGEQQRSLRGYSIDQVTVKL